MAVALQLSLVPQQQLSLAVNVLGTYPFVNVYSWSLRVFSRKQKLFAHTSLNGPLVDSGVRGSILKLRFQSNVSNTQSHPTQSQKEKDVMLSSTSERARGVSLPPVSHRPAYYDNHIDSLDGFLLKPLRRMELVRAFLQSALACLLCSILCSQYLLFPLHSLPLAADAATMDSFAQADGYERGEWRPDLPMDSPSLSAEDLSPLGAAIPQQVHVVTVGMDAMEVTWLTVDPSAPSTVAYGEYESNLDNIAVGSSSSYTFFNYRSPTIHRAVLGQGEGSQPLKPDTLYFYRCGGGGGGGGGEDAPVLSFKTPPAPGSPKISLAIVGDLGQTGWSVSTLQHMQQFPHDMVLHAGDLSYADNFQPRWDSWGRLIQPLASARPWMTVVGNHEIERLWGLEPDFKAYNARWHMPYTKSSSPSNLFYSMEAGSVHFLMLASYADYGPSSPQISWLLNDLKGIDRTRTPWVIAVLHAPWYNSNEAHQGDGDGMMAAMEEILHNAQVDMVFAGHVHAYERSARVYKGKLDPCGAIYITVGDGGNREGLATEYQDPQPRWSVRREASFGHGRLEVEGARARWSWQRNDDDESVVGDEVWVENLHSSAAAACSLPPQGTQ